MRQRTRLWRTACMALVLLICMPAVMCVSHTHRPGPFDDTAHATPFVFGSHGRAQAPTAEACPICQLARQWQAWLMLLLAALLLIRKGMIFSRMASRLCPPALAKGHPTLISLKVRMNC